MAYTYEVDIPTKNGESYFTVESYSYNIEPEVCTRGIRDVDITITKQGESIPVWSLLAYEEDYPTPYLLPEAATPGKFIVTVKYIAWWGSQHRDFTVGMYSKHDIFIKDSSGNTNELHADGSFPSEF